MPPCTLQSALQNLSPAGLKRPASDMVCNWYALQAAVGQLRLVGFTWDTFAVTMAPGSGTTGLLERLKTSIVGSCRIAGQW